MKWKRRQILRVSVVLFTQAAVACCCVYLLVAPPPYNESAPRGHHRVFQLSVTLLSNVSWSILAWNIPKRQVFYLSLVASVSQFLLCCDTIWLCSGVHVILKSLGTIIVLLCFTIIRKLGARLQLKTTTSKLSKAQVATLTGPQQILLATYLLVVVLMVIFPDFVVLPAIEICIWALTALDGWRHFFKFLLASDEAFESVESSRSASRRESNQENRIFSFSQNSRKASHRKDSQASSPKRRTSLNLIGKSKSSLDQNLVKSALKTKTRLKGNVLSNLVIMHVLLLFGFLLSPLWPANKLHGVCRPRSGNEALHHVESIRHFYTDVLQVVVFAVIWNTAYVFTAAKRRKMTLKKTRRSNVSSNEDCDDSSCASSVAISPAS